MKYPIPSGSSCLIGTVIVAKILHDASGNVGTGPPGVTALDIRYPGGKSVSMMQTTVYALE